MMNAELKAEWIAALRSGDYKQGKSFLKNDDGTFCCLGVLCDIMEPDAFAFSEVDDDGFGYDLTHPMADSTLEFIHGDFDGQTGLNFFMQEDLATKNDNGKTFVEIAAYIEENL